VDLLDLAILALRIALVVVLYAFVVLVVRAAARGLNAAAPAPAGDVAVRKSAASLRLMVLAEGSSELVAGEVLEVADGAVLGRAARAHVVVADATVSGEHARVARVGRAWVVSDLGSTNGTRVNDSPVDGERRLADGDILALGNVRLKVVGPDG
jgi:hypothetical protein